MISPVRWPPHAQLRAAKARLRQGGIIAYATESCFGLGCDPNNAKALQRVIKLKKRSTRKGMIMVGAGIKQLQPFLLPLSPPTSAAIRLVWPGPYTLVLQASHRALPWLRGIGHRHVAVRISAHPDTATLCQILGMALVSTSANRTGQQTLKNERACKKQFGHKALTLHGRIGTQRKPSTIIDGITGRILR